MAKKRPVAKTPTRPIRLAASGVVLVGDNNGCYPRGATVYYYVDPPDPGPFCYYFASLYASTGTGVSASIRHVSTYPSDESDRDSKADGFRTYSLKVGGEAEPARRAAAGAVNTCEYYLLVVTRVCFGGLASVVGSVPFRVCDTCP